MVHSQDAIAFFYL